MSVLNPNTLKIIIWVLVIGMVLALLAQVLFL